MLVQDGGDDAPVHDARPADGAGAKVDDGDGLARRPVVPDVLVGAHAAGAGQGTRRDALRARGARDALVGVVVAGQPVRVREQVFDQGEVAGRVADVGGEGGVDLGAWEERWGRGEDSADGGAGRGA